VKKLTIAMAACALMLGLGLKTVPTYAADQPSADQTSPQHKSTTHKHKHKKKSSGETNSGSTPAPAPAPAPSK
jgi:hypothetical protein